MTGGSERRDESVTFSLKELMKLEDERVDQEKKAREAREAQAKALLEEEARKKRAETAAREQADAEERERLRRRELDEEARRDAIQRAAVEQARITVEARTRAEESERERRHEIELQRLRAETMKKPGAGIFVGAGLLGAAASFGICLVLFFAVAKPASDARIAQLDRAVALGESREAELGRRIDEQKAKIEELQKDLGELTAKTAPPAATAPKASPPTGGRRAGSNSGTTPPPPKLPLDNGPCPKFDPLCGHIGD